MYPPRYLNPIPTTKGNLKSISSVDSVPKISIYTTASLIAQTISLDFHVWLLVVLPFMLARVVLVFCAISVCSSKLVVRFCVSDGLFVRVYQWIADLCGAIWFLGVFWCWFSVDEFDQRTNYDLARRFFWSLLWWFAGFASSFIVWAWTSIAWLRWWSVF